MNGLKSLWKGIAAVGAAGLISVAVAQPPQPMCNSDEVDFVDLKKQLCKKPKKVKGAAQFKVKKGLIVDGWQGCTCIKDPKQAFCKKGVKYRCEDFKGNVDAGQPDAGFIDAGDISDAGFLDSGYVDAGSVDTRLDGGDVDAGQPDAGFLDSGYVDAGYVDAGIPSIDAGQPDAGYVDAGSVDAGLDGRSQRRFELSLGVTGGNEEHIYTVPGAAVRTSGSDMKVSLIPTWLVGKNGQRIGAVFAYSRDKYDGSQVETSDSKSRNKDSVMNNNVRIGAVYLTGADGKFNNRTFIAGLEYLLEMQDSKFGEQEVNTTGHGVAVQLGLNFPRILEIGDVDLGLRGNLDLQTRDVIHKGSYGIKEAGWITNALANGDLVLTYKDFLRIFAGYKIIGVENNEPGSDISKSHQIVTGLEITTSKGWKAGASLQVPINQPGIGGKVYVGKKVEKRYIQLGLVVDRPYQEYRFGSDTQTGQTGYIGGQLTVGSDIDQALIDFLTEKYRR